MSTLTLTHPTGHVAPLSSDATRKLVVWANVAIIIVAPAVLSAAVLLKG